MNRNVHNQLNEARGVDIREPSTANLFIDSLDRNTFNYYSGRSNLDTATLAEEGSNFTINSQQNSIQGHFTRVAVQEVCMEWGVPNIAQFRNVTGFSPTTGLPIYGDSVIYDNSRFIVNVGGTPYTAVLNSGFYTVAQVMNAIRNGLTALAIPTATWTLSADAVFGVRLTCSVNYYVVPTSLSIELGFLQTTTPALFFYPGEILAPNIAPWTYVDITCEQLTYCQDVKDATTNPIKRDVLYRWYLADTTGLLDTYGFPILTGYTNFRATRLIPFPKQIKWDPIQQVAGTMRFKSFANMNIGSILSPIENFEGTPYNVAESFGSTYNYEFQMTLLLSEV
jgi:hypothetical protein